MSDFGGSTTTGGNKTKDLNGYLEFVAPGEEDTATKKSVGTFDDVDSTDYVQIPTASAADGTKSNDQGSGTSAYVMVPGTFSQGSFKTVASMAMSANDGYADLELVKPHSKKRGSTATPPALPNDPGDTLKRSDSMRRGAPSLARPTRETYASLRQLSTVELKAPEAPADPGEEARRLAVMSGAPPTPRDGPTKETYGTLELAKHMPKKTTKEILAKEQKLMGIDNSHYQQLPGAAIEQAQTMGTMELQRNVKSALAQSQVANDSEVVAGSDDHVENDTHYKRMVDTVGATNTIENDGQGEGEVAPPLPPQTAGGDTQYFAPSDVNAAMAMAKMSNSSVPPELPAKSVNEHSSNNSNEAKHSKTKQAKKQKEKLIVMKEREEKMEYGEIEGKAEKREMEKFEK
jgi:hypothetical protein